MDNHAAWIDRGLGETLQLIHGGFVSGANQDATEKLFALIEAAQTEIRELRAAVERLDE